MDKGFLDLKKKQTKIFEHVEKGINVNKKKTVSTELILPEIKWKLSYSVKTFLCFLELIHFSIYLKGLALLRSKTFNHSKSVANVEISNGTNRLRCDSVYNFHFTPVVLI